MKVYETKRSKAITRKEPWVLENLEYEITLLFDMMASKNTKLKEQAYVLYSKIQASEDLDLEAELRYMLLNHFFNQRDRRDQ